MDFAIEYRLESTQIVQALIGANQSESAFQKSVCKIFRHGIPKSNREAEKAIETFDSDSISLYLDSP